MKRMYFVFAAILMICFLCILFSTNIGMYMANRYVLKNGGTAAIEECLTIAIGVSESIRLIAGIISSFVLYISAHIFLSNKNLSK